MRKSLQLVLVALTAGAAFSASAQGFARSETPEVDVRQARQEARIERALSHGELTRFEARDLRRGQRQIARVEAASKADGFVSRSEMRTLTTLLDEADQKIRQMSHDRDTRRRH
ncbi:MAG: hypothetical protein ABIX46_03885 [Burkholderiaceae bacterium]